MCPAIGFPAYGKLGYETYEAGGLSPSHDYRESKVPKKGDGMPRIKRIEAG